VTASRVDSGAAAKALGERVQELSGRRDRSGVVAAVRDNMGAVVADPTVLQQVAWAVHDLGDLSLAEELYRRQICIAPASSAYRFIYKIYRRDGRREAGLQLLRRASVIDPRSEVVGALLADVQDGAVPAQAGGGGDGTVGAAERSPENTASDAGDEAQRSAIRWLAAGIAPVVAAPLGAALGFVVAGQLEWPLWGGAGAALFGLIVPLILMELYGFARLIGETGEVAAPLARLRGETNSYISQVTETKGATGSRFRRRSFAAALTPHPYLAYVNKATADPDSPSRPNNYGFFNREFPYERDPQNFHVLVTGGSVATQFAQMMRDGPRYLEDALNRRYVPPKGDRFVVLNGALGGWRYPQQIGIAAMTASAVDAVVSLDGFNEVATMLRDGMLVEAPGRKFLLSNPALENGYERMVGDWLAGWVFEASLGHWWARNSNYFCLVSQKLRRAIQAAFDQGDDRSYLVRIFSMPRLGRDRRWSYAIRRYTDYQRFLHGACKQVGIRSAHFLQPIPGLGKTLTDRERSYSLPLGEDVVDLYRLMESEMAVMRSRDGIPTASLVDVFRDRSDTLYADWPHCILDRGTGESEGYRLMAEAMAEELGRLWALDERHPG